jgi:hypothetical protein
VHIFTNNAKKNVPPWKNKLILVVSAILLLVVYDTIFGQFFPNNNKQMGHDYAFYLPALLDGYFWFKTNGLSGIPWFTPSFCGGSLNYININNGYYTVPQFITFFIDPVTAVHITFILFAAMGLIGFYLLLRRAFFVSQTVSFLGAGLFLFNGFYAHRILIGHLFIHSFMLLPFLTLALLRPIPGIKKGFRRQFIFDIVIGGLLFAYMVQSGFSSFMIPGIMSIVVLGLIYGWRYGRHWHFWLRLAGSGIFGILLCSSKLLAISSLMESFPRSGYTLPGAKNFVAAAWLMLKSLFLSPAFDPDRMATLTNVQWLIERHEWEYSVTFVPLAILLYGCWKISQQTESKEFWPNLSRIPWLSVGAITLLLALPVALNTFHPSWNALLKKLPMIKNSSNLIRWMIIYIPVVILMAALMLEKLSAPPKHRLGIVVVGISIAVAFNAVTNRDFYHQQNYDPKEIVTSYHKVKADLWTPEIINIGVYVDKEGNAIMPLFRNNMLVHGASQMLCYEPLFGYRLESFPAKNLHPGPALEEKEGFLNIKNPACYVWPEANNCEPGDHFNTEAEAAAKAFLTYRPFPFKIPVSQRVANYMNVFSLIAAVLLLIVYIALVSVSFGRNKLGQPPSEKQVA